MEYGVLVIRREGRLATQPKVLRLGSTALGRDPSNDVVLAAPEVSSFHARINCTTAECVIRDVNSTNGTSLNGERLKPQVEYPLRHNDVIVIGPFAITYQRPQRRAPPPDVPQPTASSQSSVWPPLNGRSPRPAPRPIEGRSDYWRFLPTFYEQADQDGVLNGLLRIFETILTPLDRMVDQIDRYFDPRLAPEALLPWLAFWVDLALDENWPIERRRALISQAAKLYRWRGTRKGMRDYIRAYTTVEPIIVEPGQEKLAQSDSPLRADVLRILKVPDPSKIDRALVELIERPLEPHVFRVILAASDDRRIDDGRLRRIIEAEKPAHTGYELERFRLTSKA